MDYVLAKLVTIERARQERELDPSVLITDAKSVQNSEYAEEKGYDAGKKKLE